MFAVQKKLLEKKLSDDTDLVNKVIAHYNRRPDTIKLTAVNAKEILNMFDEIAKPKQRAELFMALSTVGVRGMHVFEHEKIITKLNEAHDRVFIPENFQNSCCCSVM